MFSLARRGLEKAASNENDPVLQEEGMNEARVALLNALRRAERILGKVGVAYDTRTLEH